MKIIQSSLAVLHKIETPKGFVSIRFSNKQVEQKQIGKNLISISETENKLMLDLHGCGMTDKHWKFYTGNNDTDSNFFQAVGAHVRILRFGNKRGDDQPIERITHLRRIEELEALEEIIFDHERPVSYCPSILRAIFISCSKSRTLKKITFKNTSLKKDRSKYIALKSDAGKILQKFEINLEQYKFKVIFE